MSHFTVIHGRVEDVLARGNLGKFDAVFGDPPYGINFMGNAWDHGVPSAEVWAMVREHIYPGSHVVAFGGTRKWHRLACNMEDAGLEMRDSLLAWMYGQGWPKPANVSKYIDKALGADREVTGKRTDGASHRTGANMLKTALSREYDETAPGSPESTTWNGWHGNLSPAWEPALMFREPGGTYAGNALEHGVSGLWIDGNRIGTSKQVPASRSTVNGIVYAKGLGPAPENASSYNPNIGRWPANVVLCCEEIICGDGPHQPGCPVFEIDAQSGSTASSDHVRHGMTMLGVLNDDGYVPPGSNTRGHNDAGGASRFFYQAKVSRSERGDSAHPCMKPIALCRHIAGLLLQPPTRQRRLLVPYSGSGSEMIGALQAGWDEVVGIEADEGWVDLSRARISSELLAWKESRGEVTAETAKTITRPVQIGLFTNER